ncbi:hypothetical protein ACPXCX_46850, partial [Streptomyces sp. DT225]
QAGELNVALRDDHAPDTEPTARQVDDMLQAANEAAIDVTSDPDPENPLWKAAQARLTAATDFLRKHHAAYREATNDEPSDTEPTAAPREEYEAGDRFLALDGSTKTVASTMHSTDGKLWVLDTNGAGWRADRCERIDTSRVGQARSAARRAAGVLRAGDATGDAAHELGDALRYLAQADPDALAELAATGSRITVEIHRLAVVPGDVLHQHGARLYVLDTGVSTSDAPQWWATVHGVTDE